MPNLAKAIKQDLDSATPPQGEPSWGNDRIDDIVHNHIFLDNGTSTWRVWEDRAVKYMRQMRDDYEAALAARDAEQLPPLHSDEAFPWVNEYLNRNTKVGLAARIVSRWGKDWDKGFLNVTYGYAYSEIAGMADAIMESLAERASLRQQLDARDAEIAALKAEVVNYMETSIIMDMHLGDGASPDDLARWHELTGREYGEDSNADR